MLKKLLLSPLVTFFLLLIFLPSGTALAARTPQRQAQAQRVPAVTCFQNRCTGQDPVATGCSATASTVLSGGIFNAANQRIGTINLRFSSACGTNWGQVVSSIGAVPLSAAVARANGVDGPQVAECEPPNCSGFVTSTSAFTDMVWAPDVAASAVGQIAQNGRIFVRCITQNQQTIPC
jgi:hypothetical protein